MQTGTRTCVCVHLCICVCAYVCALQSHVHYGAHSRVRACVESARMILTVPPQRTHTARAPPSLKSLAMLRLGLDRGISSTCVCVGVSSCVCACVQSQGGGLALGLCVPGCLRSACTEQAEHTHTHSPMYRDFGAPPRSRPLCLEDSAWL